MDSYQEHKVYVAVGNDLQEGLKTLDWALRKWKSQSISIVILHVTYKISKDFVNTPFGKLPAASVNDEKLEVFRKYEDGKIEKLLSQCVAFCIGKVKVEIQKVEKDDEPIHKLILDFISRVRVTKLVMGISFMKPGKSKSALSGLFHIHQEKPNYCEFFIICGGKLVFLKGENDEGVMEDDQGVTVAKMKDKPNFKSWLSRIFSENGISFHRLSNSSKSLDPPDSQNQGANCVKEIEKYFQHLLSLNLDEENFEQDDTLQTSPTEAIVAEETDSNLSAAEKIESLKSKIIEAQEMIQLKKREIQANAERYSKAEWAICLCNTRADQLQALMKEEVTNRIEIQNCLDSEREQLHDVIRDVEQSKNRLRSLAELQSELSSKLQISTMAKSHAEGQLEKAVIARAEMVKDIEELRRQRDVLHRRIEFCKEKEAIGMVTRSSEIGCGYREYSAEDIILATENFSERFRLKCGGDWTNVYRGRLNYVSVAIKMLNSALSEEDFQAKVKFLTNIRHPHLVTMMGFCSELKCIVLEYMQYGNLRDFLFTSHQRNFRKCSRVLRWHDRIRIAHEVCSGLGFLHRAEPRHIIHGNLTPPNILLDRNLVAKISGFGLGKCNQCDDKVDIRALGVLLLSLLTGRDWAELVEEAMTLDHRALVRVLDGKAGKWPLDLAEEIAGITIKCLSVNQESYKDFKITDVAVELDEVRRKADGLLDRKENEELIDGCAKKEDSNDVPGIFMCPIFQEVMKNPHVAADGFSYELEAIEEWLGMGHDTSPMTNLRLKHKFLTANHTLRSLIQDWEIKKSTVIS